MTIYNIEDDRYGVGDLTLEEFEEMCQVRGWELPHMHERGDGCYADVDGNVILAPIEEEEE